MRIRVLLAMLRPTGKMLLERTRARCSTTRSILRKAPRARNAREVLSVKTAQIVLQIVRRAVLLTPPSCIAKGPAQTATR